MIYSNANKVQTQDSSTPIMLVKTSSTYVVTHDAPRIVTVSFPWKPPSNITVIPKISYLGSALCSGDGNRHALPESENITADSVESTPTFLSFQNDWSLEQNMYVQTLYEGCYSITFDLHSGNTYLSDVAFNFFNKETDVKTSSVKTTLSPVQQQRIFLNSTLSPPYPQLAIKSLEFTSAGLMVLATFTADTNEGGNVRFRSNFPCDQLLSFPGAVESLCRFGSPSNIKIYPSPNPKGKNLLMPGDVVSVLPGKVLAKCPFPKVKCAPEVRNVDLSAVVTVSAGMVVTPMISAPVKFASGKDYTLDISFSSGSGGRKWSSVNWKVVYEGNGNSSISQLAEAFLNSGALRWSGCAIGTVTCDTIPGYLLRTPGLYTFQLELKNFLGLFGHASVTVQFTSDAFVPSVRLLGPTVGTLSANQAIVVRSVISTFERQCVVPLSIDWIVYKDSEVDTSLTVNSRLYRDARTYVADANTLQPYHEYRFRIVAFCDEFYSFHEVKRYVVPTIVAPIFTNGDSVTTSLSFPLTFDVSSSYGTGPNALLGIRFYWKCTL